MNARKKKKTEVNTMNVATKYQERDLALANELAVYIERLRTDKNDERVRAEARNALVRTGVLTKQGKNRKKIVTWDD